MASKKSSAEEKLSEKYHEKERTALNNAYSTIAGQQSVQSFTAFTFEEAVDAQLELIEGKGTDIRPNLLDRVDRVEEEVKAAVAKIKDIPPEQFLDADEQRDVNTPP